MTIWCKECNRHPHHNEFRSNAVLRSVCKVCRLNARLTPFFHPHTNIDIDVKTACLYFVKSYKDLLARYESCYAGQKEQLDQAVSQLESTCNLLQ